MLEILNNKENYIYENFDFFSSVQKKFIKT